MSLTCRVPGDADIDALARVHVRCWQQAYAGIFPEDFLRELSVAQRAANWRITLADQEVFARIACWESDLVGFVSAGPVRERGKPYGDGEVYAIYVLADYHRRGFGRRLLTEARHWWASTGQTALSYST